MTRGDVVVKKTLIGNVAINSQNLSGSVGGPIKITTTTLTKGPQGPRGEGTYELWLEKGNVGTEEDFLTSLKQGYQETYIEEFMIASSIWVIAHNLKRFPSVTIVDSAGSVVYGDIAYVDENTLRVTFSSEVSGRAYLN